MDMTRLLRCFKRRTAEPSAAAIVARSLQLLDEAVRTRREVVAFHGKQWLVFSPHGLRHGTDGPHVLAYLLCGHPYLDPGAGDPSRRWVWLPVAELWGLEARGDRGRDAVTDGRAASAGA